MAKQSRTAHPPRKSIAPLAVRRIRAEIEMKDLPSAWVAKRARIAKSTTSSVLSGRMVNAKHLAMIAEVVSNAPLPEDKL